MTLEIFIGIQVENNIPKLSQDSTWHYNIMEVHVKAISDFFPFGSTCMQLGWKWIQCDSNGKKFEMALW